MKVSNRDKFLAVLLSFYMGVLPSCSDSSTNPGDSAPVLPPAETMQISQQDLNFWTQNNPTAATPGANWATAALVVTAFNLVVLAGLFFPVAFTAAALNEDPVLESDGKFHWRFSHSENGQSFALDLAAEVMPNVVKWQMFVSSTTPPLDNFLWYEGESEIGGGAGFWRFYDFSQPGQQTNFALVNWQYNADNDRTLQFTNQSEPSQGFGDDLTYAVQGDSVSVEFSKASNGNMTRIAWHRQTREGYIIATNYRNGQKSCWEGQMLDDVDCSQVGL